ncbi:hypothetical protein F5Y02DRAFT_360817 [Annulohypoxylon stygium]|nr:hypothetical protein F5Y02DRAFT_360817 [Annulohypoxylon stygium]
MLQFTYNYQNRVVTLILRPILLFATCPAFKDFILSFVENSKPKFLATDVLRCIFISREHQISNNFQTHIDELRPFVEQLLCVGADPNSKGSDMDISSTPIIKLPVIFRSSFGIFILRVFDGSPPLLEMASVYEMLQISIENHPDLEECLPLRIRLEMHNMYRSFFHSCLDRLLPCNTESKIERYGSGRVGFVFDLNVATLAMAAYEYGRRRNLLSTSYTS